jgi:hypothetical protein
LRVPQRMGAASFLFVSKITAFSKRDVVTVRDPTPYISLRI